ncbi:MAG: cytochrome c553 [Pseudohongiellaceae bacterium]|jgi:cytochrome c553
MGWRIRAGLALGLILGSMVGAAQAQRSTLTNDLLVVPRIDIAELGALELSFRVAFEGEYLLFLEDISETSLNIPNSGVFDPQQLTLELDEVMLESGDAFSLQLSLVSSDEGYVFRISEALPLSSGEPQSADSPAPSDQAKVVYTAQCSNCHGASGNGTNVGPSLIACANCGSASGLAQYIAATMPLGQSATCGAVCAADLSAYILAVFNGSNSQVVTQTVGLLQILDANATLHKATKQLASRNPVLEELKLVSNLGVTGLTAAINNMMEQPVFYDRLTEIFNDYFLTDKYHSRNGSEAAISLLSSSDYPNRRWFDPGSSNRPDDYSEIREKTNNSVAREPLELINYIVKNNRPFTEIVTADYIMVSPYSAKTYGVEGLPFSSESADEFLPAILQDIPHAGILTSPMFLNRYPTTSTNRNRGRSRVVFDLLLDTDVLAIEGVRPGNAVDITTPIPTINNPECSKCHTILDPVASLFQNWDSKGSFRPARLSRNGWYADMEARGFNGEAMPLAGNVDSSLQWLGARIAADAKFPRAITRILLNGLTGKEPLVSPNEATATQAEITAYIAERSVLNAMQAKFVADNYNLKTLVREILMSPYWRAAGLTTDADSLSHAQTGSSYLLSPEQLDRKIESLFGFTWRGSLDSYYKDKNNSYTSKLNRTFHQIYGGIDSDSVTTRLKSPNGLMGAMQLRLANELACYAVPRDLWRPQEQRNLFLFVDIEDSPYNEAGNLDESALALIGQNIQYLHAYLLGEFLALDSPELEISQQLFMTAINHGRQIILNSGGSSSTVRLPDLCDVTRDFAGNDLRKVQGEDLSLTEDRQYVIRAWMAVVAYLLADYKFLYN